MSHTGPNPRHSRPESHGTVELNPIGLCDEHHKQRQRIDRLERDALDDRSDDL